ncbi:iron-siderophore ABC transporter substrate-binding protein [Blastococcus sp. TF02A-26]|uniref:iron-siderophore ABC transporter substrate-binding protein n=1 Tax=Blastococcus sp. TF02A-26 TaxID=2250577 RepID=UPI000DEBDD9F|nr:iron-siderophore ABC transporter substrate-binding protein [Blastococcus sp. TF02A-26]RBY79969.1 iron-siderophore ABC transporter substrate-binding protein [Blastococcus sp. TF02A-26]
MSSRSPLSVAALVAAAALVLAGCGDDDPDTDTQSGAGGSSSGGAFPVTIETAFGEVTIEEEPQTVVALGWSDAETALALGVQPVGASDWLAVGGDGLGEWVEESYDEAPEMIETQEPDLEAIAALQPDLILDTRSDATQERYDSLSQIAPTVGQPEGVGPYMTTWQQQLELVGQALGKAEEAQVLADDLEQRIADAAAAHPEFAGTEVAVGAYTSQGFGAYVRGDGRVDLMEALGFVNKAAIEDEAGGTFFIPVGDEQVPLLDSELTVVFPIFVEVGEITSNPLWGTLTSVQEGRAVILEDKTVADAFSAGSVSAVGYALDNAVPLFAEALAG